MTVPTNCFRFRSQGLRQKSSFPLSVFFVYLFVFVFRFHIIVYMLINLSVVLWVLLLFWCISVVVTHWSLDCWMLCLTIPFFPFPLPKQKVTQSSMIQTMMMIQELYFLAPSVLWTSMFLCSVAICKKNTVLT